MDSLQPHRFEWTDRAYGKITGVSDVVSFESEKIVLKTGMGNLTVVGKELQVKSFSMENHEITLSGSPSSVKYSNFLGSAQKAFNRQLNKKI